MLLVILENENEKFNNYPLSIIRYPLKCSADRKAETVAFAGQKQTGQILGKADFGVRVDVVNQPKRHVDDRNLNSTLR